MRESYYVTFRSVGNDYRRVERYSAYNFCYAAWEAFHDLRGDEEIIQIERDYKV